MPAISIITPVYNGEKSLKRCIQSVMKQRMEDFEWIIVDDCSSDSTQEILKKIQERDSRIKVLKNDHNKGASKSRFRALESASGTYITFLDSDDALTTDALSLYKDAVQKSEAEIFVIGSKLVFPFIKASLKFYSCDNDQNFSHGGIPGEQACIYMLANDGLTPNLWDKLYKADLIRTFAGKCPDLSLGEDYVLNMRLIAHATTVHPVSGFGYLWSYNGLGEKYYLRRWPEYERAIGQVLTELPLLCASTPLDIHKAQKAVALNYFQCLRENCIQRILNNYDKSNPEDFVAKTLKHPILEWLDTGQSPQTCALTTERFLQVCRGHLREHRKYYIFTRIINRFLNL